MEISRRRFLESAAVGGVAIARSRSVFGQAPVKIGLIGCGWWGMIDLKAALKNGAEAVALCDIDTEHLSAAVTEVETLQGKRPRSFSNYSELLAEPGLDAVIIATPPHWHALMFVEACQRGLDIFCEKPLAYDIREGQAMMAAARKHKRVYQVGFQRRQSQAVKDAAAFIASGDAGQIRQVDAQIHYGAELRDTTVQEPPASLDWDQWCGPAPKLPYTPNIGHFAWRLEKAYGNGHLVDWGIHWIDAVRTVLGLGLPRRIQASGGNLALKEITTPDFMNVTFEFEQCPVVWKHRIWGAAEYTPEVSNGMFFYGEKATVFLADNRWEIIPRTQQGERQKHAVPGTDLSSDHMAEFLSAVRTRQQPSCSIEDGFRSTASVQLAMVALESGGTIDWDQNAAVVKDNLEATKLLKRPYRKPWKHPYDV